MKWSVEEKFLTALPSGCLDPLTILWHKLADWAKSERLPVDLTLLGIAQDAPGLTALRNAAVDELYDQMRCGLFHTGMTREKVRISNGYSLPVKVQMNSTNTDWTIIEVNPRRMLEAVEDHLSHYLMRLRDDKNTTLRANFMKAWDMRGN